MSRKSSFRRGDRQSVARATSGLCAVCKAPAPYLIERSQQWVCHRHLDGFLARYTRRVVALTPRPAIESPFAFRRWSPNDCEVRLNGAVVAQALRRDGEWHLYAWPTREKVATAVTLDELQAMAADALQIVQAA